jgi:hypothetical protein
LRVLRVKERDCESVQRAVNRWLLAEGILICLTFRLFRLRTRQQDKLVKLIMFDALTAWLEFINTAVAVRTSDIVTLVDLQLDAQNSYLFIYNTFIKIIYMFRALPCSSSGGLRRNCIYMQPLVS